MLATCSSAFFPSCVWEERFDRRVDSQVGLISHCRLFHLLFLKVKEMGQSGSREGYLRLIVQRRAHSYPQGHTATHGNPYNTQESFVKYVRLGEEMSHINYFQASRRERNRVLMSVF